MSKQKNIKNKNISEFYRNKIKILIGDIEDDWILVQILRFIKNISK